MQETFLWLADVHHAARRHREAIAAVVVHRIEVSGEDASYGDRPSEVARFFAEHPIGQAASGGRMPYPVLVTAAGGVCQLLPLLAQTPHAAAHNPTSLGIGVVGDFRRAPPPPPQWRALVGLAAAIVAGLRCGPQALVAHDALPGASRQPDKVCPGPHLALPALRAAVADAPALAALRCDLVW